MVSQTLCDYVKDARSSAMLGESFLESSHLKLSNYWDCF